MLAKSSIDQAFTGTINWLFGRRPGLRLWIWLVKHRRKFLNRTVFFSTFFTLSFFVLVAVFFQFPLQVADAFTDAQMKLAGGHSHLFSQLRAINKNTCESPADCKCVLFIHGLGDQALTWTKVFKQSPASENLNLYAVDLPGSGASPQLETLSEYGVTSLAELVHEEIFPICSEWTLVGNSFGGWVATRLALMHPSEVNGLLLVSAAGLSDSYSHIWPTFAEPTVDRLKTAANMSYANPTHWPDFIFERVIRKLERMPVRDMLMAQLDEKFLDRDLPKIKAPVRLLWGEEDQVIPISMARRFAKAMPQAELTIEQDCGHLAQQECPKAVWKSLKGLLTEASDYRLPANAN